MKKRGGRPDIRERFGFAVKVRREELGLTQEDLADRAGIHRTPRLPRANGCGESAAPEAGASVTSGWTPSASFSSTSFPVRTAIYREASAINRTSAPDDKQQRHRARARISHRSGLGGRQRAPPHQHLASRKAADLTDVRRVDRPAVVGLPDAHDAQVALGPPTAQEGILGRHPGLQPAGCPVVDAQAAAIAEEADCNCARAESRLSSAAL